MASTVNSLPVLEYLKRQIEGSLSVDDATHMRYPTAISKLLGLRLVHVEEASAILELEADAKIHGNQQGTVHGGMLADGSHVGLFVEQLEQCLAAPTLVPPIP